MARHRILLLALGAALAGLPVTQAAQAADVAAPDDNNGQDPTRPLTRVDTRLKQAENPDGPDSETFTVRAETSFQLDGGWKLSTRLDLPTVRKDGASGDSDTGFSDVLVQALFIAPANGRTTMAFGARTLLPTASDDRFGSGVYQFAPTFAMVRHTPSLGPGGFYGVLIRDQFSFGGDGSRRDINDLLIQPLLSINLKDRWFATLEPEIKIDLRDDQGVFLPFNLTVGRRINDRLVASVQADVAVINDYQHYDWQIEARLGFSF